MLAAASVGELPSDCSSDGAIAGFFSAGAGISLAGAGADAAPDRLAALERGLLSGADATGRATGFAASKSEAGSVCVADESS